MTLTNWLIFQMVKYRLLDGMISYLIFVIFFKLAKFVENKIYTEKRQFFALNL